MRITILALGAALVAAPLSAQAPDSAAIKLRQRIDAWINLPQKTDEARRAGVPDGSLQSILDILRKGDVTPQEATSILDVETAAVREHGPTDNFGAFVQAQLASGKRGQELAAAIRAEHQRNGRGRPAGAGQPGGRPDDAASKGKRPDDAGARGKRPDDAASKGKRPDDASKGKRPENPGAHGKRPF
jgi:hypothetical protein